MLATEALEQSCKRSHPLMAPFPLRSYARRQKHSESRPRGNGEIDPYPTSIPCELYFRSLRDEARKSMRGLIVSVPHRVECDGIKSLGQPDLYCAGPRKAFSWQTLQFVFG